MPELPEVEVFRRYLSRHALKQTIADVKVDCPELLEETSAWKLRKYLLGHQFQAARRHGKYLFAEIDNRTALVLHFGMTGELIYQGADDKAPAYSCLSLAFRGNKNLYYTSKRKLGLIAYTEDRRAYIKARGLGPDASSLDADKFISALADASGAIKARLMDQGRIAGLGNEYTDELLFQARMHPATHIESLDDKDLRKLHKAMVKVLDSAIHVGADTERMPADFLLPHRNSNSCCPRCGTAIKKIKVSGRSAYLCPKCQS